MSLLLAVPFRWTEPGTWPPFLDIWLAFMALTVARPVWQWWRRQQASSWPLTQGRVDSAQVDEAKWYARSSRSGNFAGVLNYSYSVAGQAFTGKYSRRFPTGAEAREFIRGTEGGAITVHSDPSKPSNSMASKSSVESLLQARPPAPTGELLFPVNSISPAFVPFVWVFAALSAVGLVVSICVHLGALAGRRIVPESFFFLLHVGSIVIWAPAVFVANKRVGSTRRKDFWKLALRGSPDWLRYMVYGFFGYAILNFLLFILNVPPKGTGGSPPAIAWRGFSGHWMAFYAASFAVLYSAVSPDAGGQRCINGHPLPFGVAFCDRCGQPVQRAGS